MNKFVKFIMILLSLGLIAGLVLVMSTLVVIPVLTGWAQSLMQNDWFATLLAVVVLVFIVLTAVGILCDFFLPGAKDKYTTERDIGQIEISDKSIESVASMAASEVPGVRRYHAKVKGHPQPGKVKLEVFAETDNTTGLATTAEQIQDHVARRLAESLDIQPHDVKVRMQPYAEARQASSARAPRVI